MKYLISILALLISVIASGQDPQRFRKEVEEINTRLLNFDKKNVICFTGSSSVRLWTDLSERFPSENIINTGFGGSQMSDMYYFVDELILRYNPKKVFIYEGDNDLGTGKTPEQILADADKLMKRLRCELSKKTKIYFITPKPSILRWNLKPVYEDYIKKLKLWSQEQKNVAVIDVWSPMLDEKGELKRDLFIDDNLHMNSKGYDIWQTVITPYLNK